MGQSLSSSTPSGAKLSVASSSSYWPRACSGSCSIWYISARLSFTRKSVRKSNCGVPRYESRRRMSESYMALRCWKDTTTPSRIFDSSSEMELLLVCSRLSVCVLLPFRNPKYTMLELSAVMVGGEGTSITERSPVRSQ